MKRMTSAITLRNRPEPVARVVRERAAAYHLSLNKAVVQLLEEATGATVVGKPQRHRDLSEFVGIWSNEEGDEFDRAPAEIRKIDPGLWE